MFGNAIINSLIIILCVLLIKPLLEIPNYIFLFNRKKSLKEIKNYIENNGIETQAEILGYYKYKYYLAHKNCFAIYYTILKFKTTDGIEHITIGTLNDNNNIKYHLGDIVNIKYIENILVNDENLKSQILNHALSVEKCYKQEKEDLYGLHGTFSKGYFVKNYYSKLDKDINLTDKITTYSTIFKI